MKLSFIFILCLLISFSCKKKAVPADGELVGTWVSNDEGYNTWLIVEPNGHAIYRTYDSQKNNFDNEYDGTAKYNIFEGKFYVGFTKFIIFTKNTGHTNGVTEVATKSYVTLKDTIYQVDRKMVLRTSVFHGKRVINFYKAK